MNVVDDEDENKNKDDKELKLKPEETIVKERVKWKPRTRRKTVTALKNLTPNKLLTRLQILLAQIKAGSNSKKLKNEIQQMLHVLYQHSKITKKVYNS